MAGDIDVPEHVRNLSSLPDADYADMFTLSTSVEGSPEQWARAMFGDVPTVGEALIFRGLLGLRLSSGRSPDTIAGWRVAARAENWVRLEAGSAIVTGNLIVLTTEATVSLATFMRYERARGKMVWFPTSTVHRRLAPGLLRDAEKLRSRHTA